MYEIDDDVPVPERRYNGREPIYPFATMEVGQSFFVPVGDTKVATVRSRIATASRALRRRGDSKAKVQTEARTENGVLGVRCWRVE